MRDAALQSKVGRLRDLMSQAVPRPAATPEMPQEDADAWRAYSANITHIAPPALEQSQRARQTRTINRIARSYGWPEEIQRALDRADVHSVAVLDDDQLDSLHARMLHLEDCVQHGCDPEDMPVAR